MNKVIKRAHVGQVFGSAAVVLWCLQLAIVLPSGNPLYIGTGFIGLCVAAWVVGANVILEQKELNHGLDRRADPQVHGDTSDGADDGTVTITWHPVLIPASRTRTFAIASSVAVRTVERTGIRLGEVEGYRAWALCGPLLLSINGLPWLPDRAIEGKELNEHNGRGVHAWKDFLDACRYVSDLAVPVAIGKVKLWGEIIEHERGYRGEFARPSQIMTIVGIPDMAVTQAIIGRLPFAMSNAELERFIRSQIDALYGLEPYQEPAAEAA